MNKTIDDTKAKLKQLWNENPVVCIVLGIAAANAGAKLMDANSKRRYAKSWDREVDRRSRSPK